MRRTIRSPDISTLVAQRFNRRALLVGSSLGVAAALPAVRLAAQPGAAGLPPRIEGSAADSVVVPPGYRSDVLLRWGDAVLPDAGDLDVTRVPDGSLLEPGAADAQARAFGAECDGIGVLALGADSIAVCVNHESPVPRTMFPGWDAARASGGRGPWLAAHPEAAGVMQAAVGLSVVELAARDGVLRPSPRSSLNRRVTAATEIDFSGPAATHPWLSPAAGAPATGLGTFGNCAAGMTPWGTYLSAEENVDDYFGRGAVAEFDAEAQQAMQRFGVRGGDSAYRWEYVDPRFDLSRSPLEPFRFGWVVEIDPRRPDARPVKRTALGRLKHEGATTVLAADGRPVVYTGDDEVFEYLYKFVSAQRYDPERSPAGDGLLDEGTLYVARFSPDGSGEWLPLVWSERGALSPGEGFRNQGDVVLRCREAADRLGATPLDRPEDVAVSPLTGRVYLSCTQNPARGGEGRDGSAPPGTDAANPRRANLAGHILELIEHDDDLAATGFEWNVFVLAGDPGSGTLHLSLPDGRPLAADDTYFAGQGAAAALSPFANPDNLGFDRDGNLWIVTDGRQPGGRNNGCFVCPTDGPDRGAVQQFMSGPIGAEICGCEFTPDGETLLLTVQHPGGGGTAEAPISDWPDGGGRPPRSSLIGIRRDSGSGPAGA